MYMYSTGVHVHGTMYSEYMYVLYRVHTVQCCTGNFLWFIITMHSMSISIISTPQSVSAFQSDQVAHSPAHQEAKSTRSSAQHLCPVFHKFLKSGFDKVQALRNTLFVVPNDTYMGSNRSWLLNNDDFAVTLLLKFANGSSSFPHEHANAIFLKISVENEDSNVPPFIELMSRWCFEKADCPTVNCCCTASRNSKLVDGTNLVSLLGELHDKLFDHLCQFGQVRERNLSNK